VKGFDPELWRRIEPVLDELLELPEKRRRLDGRRDPLGARDLVDAGCTLRDCGHLEAAIPVLREGLAIRESDPRAGEMLQARTRQELARTLRAAGETGEATGLLRGAIATFEAELPADDPQLATARAELLELESFRRYLPLYR
jgi:hypothetical protein